MSDTEKPKGVGRPAGAIVVANRYVAKALSIDGGVLPLEVLVHSMRSYWKRFQTSHDEKDRAMACAIAEKAAPYFHARLASIEHSGEVSIPTVARVPEVSKDTDSWRKQHVPKEPKTTLQ
jgi:hypothetical protein